MILSKEFKTRLMALKSAGKKAQYNQAWQSSVNLNQAYRSLRISGQRLEFRTVTSMSFLTGTESFCRT